MKVDLGEVSVDLGELSVVMEGWEGVEVEVRLRVVEKEGEGLLSR